LAGTIDALMIRNGKLEIWDYKTNKSIKTDSDYSFNRLLTPFENQWENELNKYSLQLNLYKLMLASRGIKVDGQCVLLHIPPDSESPKIMKCKDYIPQLEEHFGVNFYSNLK
jgi:hypothetical protein